MKRILLALLASMYYFLVHAQTNNMDVDRINIRVNFGPPIQDTIAAPYKIGELRTRPQDNLWYRYNGKAPGNQRWDYVYFGPSPSITPTLDQVLQRGNVSTLPISVGAGTFTSIKVPNLGQVGQSLMVTVQPDGTLAAQTIPGGGTLINSINGLTASAQLLKTSFNVATSPAFVSATATHTLNLPIVNTLDTGIVTPALYTIWNGKANFASGGTNLKYWRGDSTWAVFPTIPAQLNPTVAGGGITITGTYPNLTFTVSSAGGTITSLVGDVTTSGGTGAVSTTISANVVSYAKMQQAAANRLVGNPTASTANISEIPLGYGLIFNSGSLKVDTVSLGTLSAVALKADKAITLHIGPSTQDLSANRTFLASVIDSLQVINKGGAARWGGGTYASRPATVPSGGFHYYVTDSGRLSYNANDGNGWIWTTDKPGNIDTLFLNHNAPIWNTYVSTNGKIFYDKGWSNRGNVKMGTNSDSTLYANYFSSPLSLRNEKLITITAPYTVEGNSISAGVGAVPDTTTSWPARVFARTGLSYINRAVSNSTVRDVIARQFTNALSAKVATSLSLLIGINNLREDNSPFRQKSITEGTKTVIVNQVLDSVWAISNAKITKTGSWSNIVASNFTSKSLAKGLGNPMASTTAGNTLSFTMYDDNFWIGTYAWAASHNLGSFSVTIDGIGRGTYSGKDFCSDFTSQINTYDYRMPIVFGFTGLGAGAHAVVITLIEAKETDFDYIGKTMTVDNCKSIALWHITKCTPSGWLAYGSTYGSDLAVDSANANNDTLVNYFRLMGLPIATIPVEFYMNIATSGTTDGLHPGNFGYNQMATSFISQLIFSSGNGVTNLTITRNPTNNLINSSNGSSASQALADNTNAGLESPTNNIILGHPISFKNAPGSGDSLWYATVDTAFIKRIIGGPGIITVPGATNETLKVDSNWIKALSGWGGAGGSGMVDPGSNGFVIRTANNTTTARTLIGTTNRIVITNGTGVSANPTFDIGTDVVTLTGTQVLTNKSIIASQLTGTLQAAQFPALTGPITTVAGSLATSVANLAITNAMLAGSIDLTTKVINILPGSNGGTGVNNAGKLITLGGNLTTSGAFAITMTATGTTAITLPLSGTLLTTNGNGSSLTNIPLSISGTLNQVIVSNPTGAITLSLPQSIDATSSPTFHDLTLTTSLNFASGSTGILAATSGVVNISALVSGQFGGTGVNNSGKTITLAGNLSTSGAFPLTFNLSGATSLNLPTTGTLLTTNGSGAGLSGIVTSLTGTNNQINFSAATGAITATLPQSIATTSTPTFASVIMGGTSSIGQVWTATNTTGAGAWTTVGGTYSATTTNSTNVTSSIAQITRYSRAGNTVNYSGTLIVAPTSIATPTIVYVSIPIASTFTATNDVTGIIMAADVSSGVYLTGLTAFANTSTNTLGLSFKSGSATSVQPVQFMVQYEIK